MAESPTAAPPAPPKAKPAAPAAPPTAFAVAPVAPGATIVNTLAPPGLVVRIHSDFDRTAVLDATDAEDQVRLLRPGAIILPNLDISDLSRLPPVPAGGPAQDLTTFLDATDSDINGTLDESQLTVAKFESVTSGVASRAASVVVRIADKDAARIRGFVTGSVLGTPVLESKLGEGNREDEIGPLISIGMDVDIQIEAVTFAGDPKLPAPTGPAPITANPFKAKLPAGSSGKPILAKRTPGDVWFEIVHQDSAGKDIARPRDVALFTIAPFLLLPGTLPPKRVFVVNAIDTPRPGLTTVPGNHNFVFDLMEGCQAVFGAAAVPLPPNESAPFTPATPAHTGPFYLIDGQKFLDPATRPPLADVWIQDEIEIGYCFAPHASMHVVLHLKRNRGLDLFVHQEMAAPKVGLYDALHAPNARSDSVHYGGNIEATPPIKVATPALPAGAAGPAVKAHKPAPFGKILLGDSRLRKVAADYREFLFAQSVQPVLPVDTSWLDVGHVDEFISFVADDSPKGFKMISASIGAMTVLLEEIKKVSLADGRTHFHRGKWTDGERVNPDSYDETSVEDLLRDSKPFNDKIRADHLIPIDQRLRAGLNLAESDIVRIPTYFTPPPVARPRRPRPGIIGFQTVAQTVGSVNMLVLGKHLMIPKPFGPRMNPTDAEAVLTRAFKRLKVNAPITMPLTGDLRWVEPDEPAERMVCYYTDAPTLADRQNIIDHIKDSTVPLSPANALLVAARAAVIAAANVSNPLLVAQLLPALTGSTFGSVWFRVTIPDNKVDVVEAYMLSVLTPLGVTVHFVDDWFYHFSMGEAHCATNCTRELPETSDPKRWWDKYDPTVDVRYSP